MAPMSTLTMVRHGQAMFFGDDYDQLSELGQLQSSKLGEYWFRRGVTFDEVYMGPRTRQQKTAEFVGIAYGEAGGHWPTPIVVPELDEFDIAGLAHVLTPELARQNVAFAELLDQYRQGVDATTKLRAFQRTFEMLTGHWVTAGDSLTGLETWPTFRRRVEQAVRNIMDQQAAGDAWPCSRPAALSRIVAAGARRVGSHGHGVEPASAMGGSMSSFSRKDADADG